MKLTRVEEEIMEIFWELGKAFPKEVVSYLKEPKPPYNTILSTIRKLEKDGWLAFRIFGKSHQYYPLIDKKKFSKSVFSKLYHNYLNSDSKALLSYFMEEENINLKELEDLIKSLKSNI